MADSVITQELRTRIINALNWAKSLYVPESDSHKNIEAFVAKLENPQIVVTNSNFNELKASLTEIGEAVCRYIFKTEENAIKSPVTENNNEYRVVAEKTAYKLQELKTNYVSLQNINEVLSTIYAGNSDLQNEINNVRGELRRI